MKIKDECLDMVISCPNTTRKVYVRFIKEDMYQFYIKNGYQDLFEEEIVIEKKPTKVIIEKIIDKDATPN